MPRSAPGPATARPSRSTRPVLGRSSPATMRRSVDFPQPEGPRMVMKSFSATSSVVGSTARVGLAPRTPGNTRETPSMRSLDARAYPFRRVRSPSALADRRDQALEEAVDRLVVDPADHGDEVVLGVHVDDVGAVADMGEGARRGARPELLVGVEKPVHEAVGALGRGRG